MHFILIAGLPGSGKTTYGRSLGVPFLDDWTQEGGDIGDDPITAISDIGFLYPKCSITEFLTTKYPGCTFEWVAFTNEPDKSWKNMEARNETRSMTLTSLRFLGTRYVIPEGATILPTYTKEQSA